MQKSNKVVNIVVNGEGNLEEADGILFNGFSMELSLNGWTFENSRKIEKPILIEQYDSPSDGYTSMAISIQQAKWLLEHLPTVISKLEFE